MQKKLPSAKVTRWFGPIRLLSLAFQGSNEDHGTNTKQFVEQREGCEATQDKAHGSDHLKYVRVPTP